MPIKHLYTTQSVATISVKEVVWLYGVPQSILSYHNPLFVSNFWKRSTVVIMALVGLLYYTFGIVFFLPFPTWPCIPLFIYFFLFYRCHSV